MNRFEQASPSKIKYVARAVPILFFACVLVIFLVALSSVSETTAEKQKESLETALSHSIAQCYAVEGHYPEDLTYLTTHYGLTYDHDSFVISYTYYGDNLYPDFTVVKKTGLKLN